LTTISSMLPPRYVDHLLLRILMSPEAVEELKTRDLKSKVGRRRLLRSKVSRTLSR
jgi:hypothetical protein